MQNPPSPKTPLKKRKIRTHLNVTFRQCDHLRKDVCHVQILHLIPLACGLKTWYTLAFYYCVRDITDFTQQNLLLLTQLFTVFQLCSSMLWLQYSTYLSTPFLLCFVWISNLFIFVFVIPVWGVSITLKISFQWSPLPISSLCKQTDQHNTVSTLVRKHSL